MALPDFTVIPRVAARAARADDDPGDQTLYENEIERLDRDKLEVDLEQQRQVIALRNDFARQILRYLWAFSGFCAAMLILQGFNAWGFRLETTVMVTLVGGTAASAFGLISVVLGGLFRGSGASSRTSSNPR